MTSIASTAVPHRQNRSGSMATDSALHGLGNVASRRLPTRTADCCVSGGNTELCEASGSSLRNHGADAGRVAHDLFVDEAQRNPAGSNDLRVPLPVSSRRLDTRVPPAPIGFQHDHRIEIATV